MSNLNDQLADMLETYGKIKMANEISSAINNLAASNMAEHTYVTEMANEISDAISNLAISNMAEHQVQHTYVTEWDKNLHALAETDAKCFIRLHRGICTEEECKDCQTHILFQDCYYALSSCDKLKVDNEVDAIIKAFAQEEAAQKAQQKEAEQKAREEAQQKAELEAAQEARQKALKQWEKDDNNINIFLCTFGIVTCIVLSILAFCL